MWHSCGRHSLDELFPGDPSRLAVAEACVRLLTGLGDVQVLPQKTRLVCVARVRFAGLYPRRGAVLLSFALRRRLDSPRIVRREDYGPGWQAARLTARCGHGAADEVQLTRWAAAQMRKNRLR